LLPPPKCRSQKQAILLPQIFFSVTNRGKFADSMDEFADSMG
jgi:hypothetical protein